MNDMILYQAKSPAESHSEWDLCKPIKRIPAADVYPPLENSECQLL